MVRSGEAFYNVARQVEIIVDDVHIFNRLQKERIEGGSQFGYIFLFLQA